MRIHEHTAGAALERDDGRARRGRAPHGGAVGARRVLLATGAFPPLLRALRAYVAPVYDYVLVTEPLTAAQRAAIGWRRRQGIGDCANQFHYYRLTADGRILWGGYDAVYRYGGAGRRRTSTSPTTPRSRLLAQHFFATFPQLEGLRFTHRWGGAIDTCSRFCVFFGTAHGGRVAYAAGYTGLGVGATRSARRWRSTCSTGARPRPPAALRAPQPVPFPPEPLRFAVIQLDPHRARRAPTATAAGAACGCARSTGSGSASTPERDYRGQSPQSHLGPG